jgi:hypothetical protein
MENKKLIWKGTLADARKEPLFQIGVEEERIRIKIIMEKFLNPINPLLFSIIENEISND